jgi:hypothetical protein
VAVELGVGVRGEHDGLTAPGRCWPRKGCPDGVAGRVAQIILLGQFFCWKLGMQEDGLITGPLDPLTGLLQQVLSPSCRYVAPKMSRSASCPCQNMMDKKRK